jgi:hypothetical protein
VTEQDTYLGLQKTIWMDDGYAYTVSAVIPTQMTIHATPVITLGYFEQSDDGSQEGVVSIELDVEARRRIRGALRRRLVNHDEASTGSTGYVVDDTTIVGDFKVTSAPDDIEDSFAIYKGSEYIIYPNSVLARLIDELTHVCEEVR